MRKAILFTSLLWFCFCIVGGLSLTHYVSRLRAEWPERTERVRYVHVDISPEHNKEVHVIEFDPQKFQAGGKYGTLCTAFSLAPHALLSATHCERPTNIIKIDGKKAEIAAVLRDGNDHSIFLLHGATFTSIGHYNFRELSQGERLIYWGNPDGVNNIYREGIYVGERFDLFDGRSLLLTARSIGGDSGAPIFDITGTVVGVLSGTWYDTFTVMLPVRFTKLQLMQADTFK